MADIIIRDLSPDVVERLEDRAKRHGLSVEEEVRDIIESVVPSPASAFTDPLEISDYWHRRLAGRMTSDSADLIREDRER
jgi:plasmid stability protein